MGWDGSLGGSFGKDIVIFLLYDNVADRARSNTMGRQFEGRTRPEPSGEVPRVASPQ